jgi:hypothetical protein
MKSQTQMILLALATALLALVSVVEGKKVHYIYWNRNNPLFRIDNTDHIVDVNKGNLPWEYDQVNLICPTSKPGTRYPEKHVIYSVSREEYDSCRITNPKPRIVAICNRPHRLMYFTITFRSFTPTPGGLEFRPGHDYYFISTSSRDDLHRRVGGGCSTHNMKMIFKVRDNTAKETSSLEDHLQLNSPRADEEQDNLLSSEPVSTTTTRPVPGVVFNSKVPKQRGEYIYYYHPRDLIDMENSVSRKKVNLDVENDVLWKNEAMRYTSSASYSSINVLLAVVPALVIVLLGR